MLWPAWILNHLRARSYRNYRVSRFCGATRVSPKIDNASSMQSHRGDGVSRLLHARCCEIPAGWILHHSQNFPPLFRADSITSESKSAICTLSSSTTIRHPWRRRELPLRAGSPWRRATAYRRLPAGFSRTWLQCTLISASSLLLLFYQWDSWSSDEIMYILGDGLISLHWLKIDANLSLNCNLVGASVH
jgi:hypothetical protein